MKLVFNNYALADLYRMVVSRFYLVLLIILHNNINHYFFNSLNII